MPNMNSIQLKTKELVTYYCSGHGDLITIATRYMADDLVWRFQGTSIPNMDSIKLKTKELLTYYCGCHGNLFEPPPSLIP